MLTMRQAISKKRVKKEKKKKKRSPSSFIVTRNPN
jgi:hypothetical protein